MDDSAQNHIRPGYHSELQFFQISQNLSGSKINLKKKLTWATYKSYPIFQNFHMKKVRISQRAYSV